MTSEQQRIAIAEFCGRKYHRPSPEELKSGSYYQYEPDYTGDLNAMAEVEQIAFRNELPPSQPGYYNEAWYRYLDNLQIATGGTKTTYQEHRIIRASAAERAEAFLKTIGKWNENSS